jgi:phosphopantothenoylcysteine synthetase/decarboxylase
MSCHVKRQVLVTAGSTRNPVDAMRYIAAYSSGRTGARIADSLGEGCEVHMLGSPEAVLRVGPGVQCHTFTTTRDLMTRMEEWIAAHRGATIVHSAAVGDFETEARPEKISSAQGEMLIRLTRAPKIADHIKKWDADCTLVTFKAAGPNTTAEQLIAICRSQLTRTRSDLVFGNVIGALEATSTLVDAYGAESFDLREAALSALAARLHN